jgi:protein-disulfide isomerase
MRKEFIILGAIAVAVIAIAVIGTNYYRNSVQNERITTASSNSNGTTVSSENLIRSDSPTLGPANASVTLVEFLDPECESCAAFSPVVKNILKENEGKIRFVVRYMPRHPNSFNAATFTEAAGEQGKYWEAQELLFKKQPEWGTKHGAPTAEQPDVSTLLKKYADELGLDKTKIDSVFAERRYTSKLQRDLKDGEALGVRQTPTFFVNGRRLARFSEADLRALINEELAK